MTQLRQIRSDAAQGYRVRMFASGTVPTGTGSTTTLYDPNRTEPVGDWDRVDTWLLLTSGTNNNGLVRRVTGWSAGSVNTLTFSPAATDAVGSGSTYQMFKTFSPSDWTLAINSGLSEMYPERRVISFATAAEPNGTPTVANTNATNWIPVPSAAANVNNRLLWVERSVATTTSDYNYERLFDGADYSLIEASGGNLNMQFKYIPVMSYNLRFVYEAPLSSLVNDTDDCAEPEDVIILTARKYIALMEGDQAGVQKWGAEANAAKQRHVEDVPARPIHFPIIGVVS